MAKERLHYIDVAKGLLILLVIVPHVDNVARRCGIDCAALNRIGWTLSYFFAGFFMQAFFMLNGFTSNFNKPFKTYLWSSFKSLIIPYVVFSFIVKGLEGLCFGDWSLWVSVGGGDEQWLWIDDTYWFLTALFFARIIYWIVNRYVKSEWARGLILLVLVVIGTWLNNVMDGQVTHPSHWANHLHYRNALCMTIFIWIGHLLRKHDDKMTRCYVVATVLYVVGLAIGIVTHHTGITMPYTHFSDMTLATIPFYLFFATTGSMATVWLSRKINHSRLLEYYGRGSIVVYVMHFFYLAVVVRLLSRVLWPTGYLNAALFFTITFISVSIMCAATIWLFEKPYLRKLIGK